MAVDPTRTGVIYRCPLCLDRLIDVVIDRYDDDRYHCVKCGYVGTEEELAACYAVFRARYRLRGTRLTLEQQRRL